MRSTSVLQEIAVCHSARVLYSTQTIRNYCCGNVQYSFLSFYSVNSTKDLSCMYEPISHDDTFWILWNSQKLHLQPLIRYVNKKYQQQTWKVPTGVFRFLYLIQKSPKGELCNFKLATISLACSSS